MSSISKIKNNKENLYIKWSDGEESNFNYYWLRDNCPTAHDKDSNHRMFNILEISKENSWWGRIHQSILDHIMEPRDQILKVQPNHPRGLSGFNLFEAWDDQLEEFNWIAFLSGSEGTLGLGVSFKIKTTTILNYKLNFFHLLFQTIQRLIRYSFEEQLLLLQPKGQSLF